MITAHLRVRRHLKRHALAIPQYVLGYGSLLNHIGQLLHAVPALKLAGNYLGGISLSKTVTHAAGVVCMEKVAA